MKLQEVFGLKDINDLPIVYNIAWYEQKAVIVLLALLALGVKKIHLGPTLPAFLSPNVKQVLIDNFGIGGISTADEDIAKYSILHGHEQLFASKYKTCLPSEEQLREEIEIQKRFYYLQKEDKEN